MFTKHNRNGFSLVELMVVVALLGTIIAVGYQLLFFGQNSFKKGEAQSILQNEIRTASDFISREIRNAYVDPTAIDPIVFTLESGPPATFDSGYCYIYCENSKICYRDGAGTTVAKTAPVITEFTCSLQNSNSSIPSNGKNYIHFIIKGESGSQKYDITSEVLLNNIKGISEIANKTFAYIKYKKP